MAMKDKMYKNSPKLGRSESGGMEVTRHQDTHMEKHGGTAGTEEAIPHHVRHAHERHSMHAKHVHEKMQMHGRHEHEHHMAGEGGHDKHEMHGRHVAEHEAMHKQQEKEMMDMMARHESEAGAGDAGGEAGGAGQETGGGQISKVENQE